MGFLDAPAPQSAFEPGDNISHVNVWFVANITNLPSGIADGDIIVNTGASTDPYFDAPDFTAFLELGHEVRHWMTKTRGIHEINDTHTLMTARHFGCDPRAEATSMPVPVASVPQTLSPGTGYLARLLPFENIAVSSFLIESDGTAAGSPTHIYMGLYEGTGPSRQLVAATVDLAGSALNATGTLYKPAIDASTTGGTGVPYALLRGHEYEVCVLQVGGTGAAVRGTNVGASGARFAKALTGLSALPSSFTETDGNFVDTSAFIWCGVSE